MYKDFLNGSKKKVCYFTSRYLKPDISTMLQRDNIKFTM